MKDIKFFKQIEGEARQSCGGKGTELGKMYQAKLPVPDGFVITTSVYRKILTENNLKIKIKNFLKQIDYKDENSVNIISQKIGEAILAAEISNEIKGEIMTAFGSLKAKYVAVRSSATSEDGKKISWAGELETFLNTSESTLLANIKKCIISLYAPRALYYQYENKINNQEQAVAIIIQKMVESDVAGVAFSIHPATQEKNHILIEAAFGLGESLVAGLVTPDNYVINRNSEVIVEKNVLRQKFKLEKGEKGGVRQKKLKMKEGYKQKLNDKRVVELARLVKQIEKFYGYPCDIEWSLAKNKIYILQSRPITTLKESSTVDLRPIQPSYEQMWEGFGFSALSMDLLLMTSTDWLRRDFCSYAEKNWILVHDRGQCTMYYSKQDMEQTAYWGIRDFLNDGWFNAYLKKSKNLYDYLDKISRHYSQNKLSSIPDDELYRLVRLSSLKLAEMFGCFIICQPQCVAGLETELERELLLTVPKKSVRKVMLDLTRSEKRIMLDEERLEWLKICSKKLNSNDLNKSLLKHAHKYGILGTANAGAPYNIDYYKKLYKEGSSVKARVELKKILKEWGQIPKTKKKLIAKYKIFSRAIKIADILAETGHNRFELRLRGWMPLFFWFSTVLLTTVSNRYGVTPNLLNQMTFDELLILLTSHQIDKKELQQRQKYFIFLLQNGRLSIKSGDKGKQIAKAIVPPLPKSIKKLEGQVGYPGLIRGRAYVLRWNSKNLTADMKAMPKGAILIVGQTLPDLMPVIRKASAIVTDEGGITSHSAIVSREFGIPCIIGARIATKIIKTGDKLEVDANNGIVRLYK